MVFLIISIVILSIFTVAHLMSVLFYITDTWNNYLSTFFPTKRKAYIFFVPIIGEMYLLIRAIKIKINEDFGE